MEKVILPSGTVYRHYIPAGSSTVILARWSTGSNPIYYATSDHLGSTSTVTDPNGALITSEHFAALGWMSSGSVASLNNATRRGFTGQEMLDNVFAVNMNARVYQYSGVYFYSPDPFVPDPTNTQSFNRYAYANNNPLSFVDPTGFDPEPCDIDHNCVNVKAVGDGIAAQAPPTPISIPPLPGYIPENLAFNPGPGFAPLPPPINTTENSPCSGMRSRVGAGLANWGRQMTAASNSLAGQGAVLAVGSALAAAGLPVTAPVAAVGISAGLGAAAVGGVGSVVGGVAQWLGGVLQGDPSAAGQGFVTFGVNGILTLANAPPLPPGVPDPAEIVSKIAGIPQSGAASCH